MIIIFYLHVYRGEKFLTRLVTNVAKVCAPISLTFAQLSFLSAMTTLKLEPRDLRTECISTVHEWYDNNQTKSGSTEASTEVGTACCKQSGAAATDNCFQYYITAAIRIPLYICDDDLHKNYGVATPGL